jgi:hypothetical protein
MNCTVVTTLSCLPLACVLLRTWGRSLGWLQPWLVFTVSQIWQFVCRNCVAVFGKYADERRRNGCSDSDFDASGLHEIIAK